MGLVLMHTDVTFAVPVEMVLLHAVMHVAPTMESAQFRFQPMAFSGRRGVPGHLISAAVTAAQQV